MQLGMPHARFQVEFTESIDFHYYGKSEIKFLFSANKGTPLMEVAKVASGGELSRLMLVMKYISAKSVGLNTLFFELCTHHLKLLHQLFYHTLSM